MKKLFYGFMLLIAAMALHAESLTTTFASNNGYAGNMFDIVTKNDITVTGFDVNVNTDTTIEIYGKNGTHVGSETTPGDWTLLATVPVVSAGPDNPTSLQDTINLSIPSGTTYAFYIVTTTGSYMDYTNGSDPYGIYVENADLEIHEGTGLGYFSSLNVPRVWNGTLYYTIGAASTVPVPLSDAAKGMLVLLFAATGYFIFRRRKYA